MVRVFIQEADPLPPLWLSLGNATPQRGNASYMMRVFIQGGLGLASLVVCRERHAPTGQRGQRSCDTGSNPVGAYDVGVHTRG